jgi:hypothetical protein
MQRWDDNMVAVGFLSAFAADDRASVDAFHEAAIAAGTTMVVPGLARVPSVLLWGLRPRSGR